MVKDVDPASLLSLLVFLYTGKLSTQTFPILKKLIPIFMENFPKSDNLVEFCFDSKRQIIQDFETAQRDTSLSDITFVCEDGNVLVSKFFLIYASSYYEALFRSGMKESTANMIEMPEMPCSTLEKLFRYFYTGATKQIEPNDAAYLLFASSHILDAFLKQACEDRVIEGVEVETVGDIYELAKSLKLEKLEDFCWTFMKKNSKSILTKSANGVPWELLEKLYLYDDPNNAKILNQQKKIWELNAVDQPQKRTPSFKPTSAKAPTASSKKPKKKTKSKKHY
jgi:hypothetical protein